MSTQRRVRHLWNGKACTCNCRSCALDGLGSEVVYAARAFSRGATMCGMLMVQSWENAEVAELQPVQGAAGGSD